MEKRKGKGNYSGGAVGHLSKDVKVPAKVKVPNIASKELVEKNMNALSVVSSKSDSPLLQCSSKIKDCNIVQQNLPHQ